jgi:hypothetical protein
MGDWSDYFEDFPEENPANYVNGRYDPQGANAHRAQNARIAAEQAELDKEIREIIEKHGKPSSQGKKPGR